MTALVYLDANILIANFEAPVERQSRVRRLFAAVEQGKAIAVASELCLAECLVGPLRMENRELADAYRALFAERPDFKVKPVTRPVLEAAARLRARRSALRLPDAIHLATALDAGCRVFVTDDRRLWADLPDLAFTASDDDRLPLLLESLA